MKKFMIFSVFIVVMLMTLNGCGVESPDAVGFRVEQQKHGELNEYDEIKKPLLCENLNILDNSFGKETCEQIGKSAVVAFKTRKTKYFDNPSCDGDPISKDVSQLIASVEDVFIPVAFTCATNGITSNMDYGYTMEVICC